MNTLKQFLIIARLYWGRRENWYAWLIFLVVIGCSMSIIQVGVSMSAWDKAFYDALANFNGQAMPTLVAQYVFYLLNIVVLVVAGSWLRKTLMFWWRDDLTAHLQEKWLENHRQYTLQLIGEPDNPDQRIAEDVALLAEKSLDMFRNFLMNVTKLVAFVAILWQLSGVQSVTLFGQTFVIYGYLVWIALIYTIICTLFTHFIGQALHKLNIERQHREADYRATLLRVRDHSEQIAFYKGEAIELKRLNRTFSAIRQNWHALILRELKLEAFSATYLRASNFIPIVATLPLYLAKAMTFGDMMQARSAFSNVQDGFGWFMDYYKRIMEWSAVVARIYHFYDKLNQTPTISILKDNKTPLYLNNVSIYHHSGKALMTGISCSVKKGQWLLLDGSSGLGKTTLLRVIAGIWTAYDGQVIISPKTLFLSQKPYLPEESLKWILSYPTGEFAEDILLSTLEKVGMERLKGDLYTTKNWMIALSGGEQQRICLARALLQKPDLLCLDEATNQLDDTATLMMFELVRQYLPQTAVIAITHQAAVKIMFGDVLDLECHRVRN